MNSYELLPDNMKRAYNNKPLDKTFLLYWISVPQHKGIHQGYIGVTGLTEVGLGMRYAAELAFYEGGEKGWRTVHHQMSRYSNSVTISIIGKGLLKKHAYMLEESLRPEDNRGDNFSPYNWNEVKGGENLNV